MEGNDLGQAYGKRFVIMLEPTIYSLSNGNGSTTKRLRDYLKIKNWDKKADEYILNEKMVSWMVWFARHHSILIKVWSFLPVEIFDRLQLPLERLAGDYIVEWAQWEREHDAYFALKNDPDILAVYDADMDRVERLWQFRGTRVQEGEMP